MTSTQPKRDGSSKRVVLMVAVAAMVMGGAVWVLVPRLRAGREKPKEASAQVAAIELVHLEPFTVNLADSEHTFLRIGIDLGVQPAKDSREEKNKSPEISISRDTILTRLSAATSSELSSAEGRQKLKSDLLTALNVRAPQLQVREIYITEFLIQR